MLCVTRVICGMALFVMCGPTAAAFAQPEASDVPVPVAQPGSDAGDASTEDQTPSQASDPASAPASDRADEDSGLSAVPVDAEPVVDQSADEASVREPDEDDGPSITVDRFSVSYLRDHPQLPYVTELRSVRFDLVEAEAGFLGARPGDHAVSHTLASLSDLGPRVYFRSALEVIQAALIAEFNRRGLVGVFAYIDPSQLDTRGERFGDRRDQNDQSLGFRVFVGTVSEVRSVASGSRINTEERINSPAHRRIRDRSPVQPWDGEALDRQDLVRQDQLDDYVLRLNRHPGRRVDVAVAPGRNPGEATLDFLVQENDPGSVYAQLLNTGTAQTERLRERFGYSNSQFTGNDDIFTIDYITAGFAKAHSVVSAYDFRIPGADDRLRGRIFGGYSTFEASDVGVTAERFEGESFNTGMDLTLNVFQHRDLFIDVFAGARIENIRIDNRSVDITGEEAFFLPRVGARLERYRDTSTLDLSVSFETNISSVTGAKESEVANLGRLSPDLDFSVIRYGLFGSTYLEPLIRPSAWNDPNTPESSTLAHEIVLNVRGQTALGNRLIPNYQQTVGGLFTVRGYPESILAGDDAIIATLEYKFHLPRAFGVDATPPRIFGREFRIAPDRVYGRPDWDQVFRAFLDVGRVVNNDRLSFEEDRTISGAGVGFDLVVLRNASLRMDWAFAMNPIEENDVQVGDSRVHFVATLLF